MMNSQIKILGLLTLVMTFIGCPAAHKLTNGVYRAINGEEQPASFYWNKDQGIVWLKVYDPKNNAELIIHENFHFSAGDLSSSLDGKVLEGRLQSAGRYFVEIEFKITETALNARTKKFDVEVKLFSWREPLGSYRGSYEESISEKASDVRGPVWGERDPHGPLNPWRMGNRPKD